MEVENIQTIYNKIKMAAKWIENAKKLLKQKETELIALKRDNELLKKEIETLKNDKNQNIDFYKNLEIEIDNILALLPDSLFESTSENRENHQEINPTTVKSEQLINVNTGNNLNSNNNQNKVSTKTQNILNNSLIDTNEPTFDFDLESSEVENEDIIDLPKGVL